MGIRPTSTSRITSHDLDWTAASSGPPPLWRGLTTGLAWALALFALLVWIWGSPNRTTFGSPDEALSQLASRLIVEQGSPSLEAPIPDPEGLFVPRLWAKRGDVAVPTHTPTTPYLLAAARRLLPAGAWFVLVLPALGLGAAVAGTWLLLPRSRWLANLLPGLSFPWTFRFLKPWENMSLLVSFVSIAFLLGVLWHRTRRRSLFVLAWLFVAIAASVRPDQVHLLVIGGLLLSLVSAATTRWAWALAAVAAALATTTFLLGNEIVTGSALVPPVYLLERKPGVGLAGRSLPIGLSQLVSLFAPNGIPPRWAISLHIQKYFLSFGTIWVLSLAFLTLLGFAIWRNVRSKNRRRLTLWTLLIILFALYAISRVNTANWGATSPTPSLGHSYPRYIALIYAAMGATVLFLLTRVSKPDLKRFGATVLLVASAAGVWYLYAGEPRTSLKDAVPLIHSYEEYRRTVDAELPTNAILYVRFADKFLWSVRPTAVLPTEPGADKEHLRPELLAASLTRATQAGFAPYVMELTPSELVEVDADLARQHLVLTPVNIGETPTVKRLLLRWKTWKVVPSGGDLLG